MLWSELRLILKTRSVTLDFFTFFIESYHFLPSVKVLKKMCVWEGFGRNVLNMYIKTKCLWWRTITCKRGQQLPSVDPIIVDQRQALRSRYQTLQYTESQRQGIISLLAYLGTRERFSAFPTNYFLKEKKKSCSIPAVPVLHRFGRNCQDCYNERDKWLDLKKLRKKSEITELF